MRNARVLATLTVIALLLLSACAGGNGLSDLGRDPRSTATSAAPAPTASAAPVVCSNATQSYDADASVPAIDALPAGSTMAAIRQRGYLIAGVSADTWLMGARNPFTGDIEGFDIDVVHSIAKAILGDPDKVQYRVLTSDARITALQQHQVDIVVRAFSMTCDRWTKIAFSTEYYQAGQKLLVSTTSKVGGLADLDGERVCAPTGTTTLTNLAKYPKAKPVEATTHTQCLAFFQEGRVDAITGDDTVLAGLAAQDPYAKVVGDAISAEHYGVGIPADQVDMVRFVNAVLAQRVADGRWQRSYDQWLAPKLGDRVTIPQPVYGRQQ